MKKLLVVIVLALAVAATVWVILRVQLAHRLATVPELLPAGTLVLAEVPDFRRTLAQWHESDLDRIWREPSVQAWLAGPLGRLPKGRGGRQTLTDFLNLGPTHGFVALTSLENNEPKLIGGFHFDKSPEEAGAFVEQRKAQWLPQSRGAKGQKTVYEQHEIETLSVSGFVLASVCDNHWFFVANDLAALKALLDRADHRGEKTAASLQAQADFANAVKHLPTEYAGLLFVDPRPFVEKLMPLVAMTGRSLPLDQLQRLKQVQAVAAALGFDHGKMRETDFMAIPRIGPGEKLARRALGLAGANTFFYFASRPHWPENIFSSSSSSSSPAALALPAALQPMAAALKARGMTEHDLSEAFGEELEIIGDWPADSRWPVLELTLPVKDASRARKIAEALTSVEIAGTPWTRSERKGATFYSAEPFGGIVPLHLALAVTDEMILAGSDASAIESMLARMTAPASELEKSAVFREAVGQLPAGDSAFGYVDTRLLFERADAALRPLLLMGAAFSPSLGRNVDPGKLPPPEAISQNLTPIVMSQRYEGTGYVTDSIGPVTFREATIALAAAIGGLFINLQDRLKDGRLLPSSPINSGPSPVSTAAPSPATSPF